MDEPIVYVSHWVMQVNKIPSSHAEMDCFLAQLGGNSVPQIYPKQNNSSLIILMLGGDDTNIWTIPTDRSDIFLYSEKNVTTHRELTELLE